MINRTVYTPLQKYMARKAVAATAPKATAAATATATAPATVQTTCIFRPTTTGDDRSHRQDFVYTPLQMYDCHYHDVLSTPRRSRRMRMMSSMPSSSSSSSSSITGDEIRRGKEEEEDWSSTPTSTTTKDVNMCYYYPYILRALHSSLNEPSYGDQQRMMNLTAPTLEDNQVLSQSEIERLKANLCCL